MIKFLTFRVLRWRLKNYLPKVNKTIYKKIFTSSYKLFLYLKPSQLWVIILALLNKTEFKNLLSIPSLFILFSSLFYNSENPENLNSKLDQNLLYAKLDANKIIDPENNWESFFWFIIIIAIINRFIIKLLWLPFKLALIFYLLKYFGLDFSYLFNILNTLSLGIIDWFYVKLTNFIELIFNNKKNNNG